MKVLLAYDGLAYSHAALEHAAALARDDEAAVTVLSVVPPEARGAKSGGHMGLPPHAQEAVADAKAFLAQREVPAETKVAHGKPAEEILREAATGSYDAIVMGTRELGPIGQLVLGSVSRKVVKEAPCAVIVAGATGIRRFEEAAARV
jgi:nucleotide-binding universal stress UspA family protein